MIRYHVNHDISNNIRVPSLHHEDYVTCIYLDEDASTSELTKETVHHKIQKKRQKNTSLRITFRGCGHYRFTLNIS